jgi:hypothetical protein
MIKAYPLLVVIICICNLIDPEGRIAEIKKYPVNGATIKGNIDLNNSMAEGYYILKAVTPANVNNVELVYSKGLYIHNPVVRSKDTITIKKISIQFFPESGNLIDSVFTQVGFKATDEYGNPADVSGVIKSGNDAIVSSFRSLHNGIGRFIFKPKLGQKYFAEIDINGKTFTYPLPAIQSSGINLKVEDEPNGKVYELARNTKTSSENIILMVKLNNEIVFENQIPFGDELLLRGHLNTKDLPSGILHFTVLNSQRLPLAERLSFVNNGEYKRDVSFEVVRTDMAKRGMNKYTVRLPENIQTSCSVSITDAAANDFPDKENIFSRLLLSSDLKGYIYDPAWYFKNNDNKTQEALDNIMMIHGWSRFNIKKESTAAQQLNDKYLITVSGIVNDAKTGRAVSKGALDFGIVSEDSTTQKVKIPVDKTGRFVLDSLLVFGHAKLYYKYSTDAGKAINTAITPDKILNETGFYAPNFPESSLPFPPIKNNIYQKQGFTIIPVEKVTQLPEVVVQKKAMRPVDKVNEEYSKGMFRSSGKVVLDNINHPYTETSLSVVDYIKTNINSIQLTGGGFVNRKNFSLGGGLKLC